MLSCLVSTTLAAPSEEVAIERLGHLSNVRDLSRSYVEQLRDGAAQSPFVADSDGLRTNINALLEAHGLSSLETPTTKLLPTDDDLPF